MVLRTSFSRTRPACQKKWDGMVDSFFAASSHWTEGRLTFVRKQGLYAVYICIFMFPILEYLPSSENGLSNFNLISGLSNHSSGLSNPSKWFVPRDHALAARSACCCSCCRTNVGSPVDIKKNGSQQHKPKDRSWSICFESALNLFFWTTWYSRLSRLAYMGVSSNWGTPIAG